MVPLERAIETYNRYRSPMATASILSRSADEFRIRFEGPFCTTCCRDDYVEDLIYELAEYGVDPETVSATEIERTDHETYDASFVLERNDRTDGASANADSCAN